MYAMCAGRTPFHADSAIAVLRQVSDFAPASLQERNRKIPLWLPVDISNKTGMTLRLIPPGEFLMGAPDSDAVASPEEKPQHLVRLTRPFYMGTTEVTVGPVRCRLWLSFLQTRSVCLTCTAT